MNLKIYNYENYYNTTYSQTYGIWGLFDRAYL